MKGYELKENERHIQLRKSYDLDRLNKLLREKYNLNEFTLITNKKETIIIFHKPNIYYTTVSEKEIDDILLKNKQL